LLALGRPAVRRRDFRPDFNDEFISVLAARFPHHPNGSFCLAIGRMSILTAGAPAPAGKSRLPAPDRRDGAMIYAVVSAWHAACDSIAASGFAPFAPH
jgi:hypothetical protein